MTKGSNGKAGNVRLVIQEYDLDALDDSWESLVSAGLEIVRAHDGNRWALGDIAGKCERKHGESSLKSFANSLRIKASIMYDYHHVADFFADRATRTRFQSLAWSHYREVARLDDKVADDYETAMDLLEKAEDNHWTVDDLKDEVDRLIGKPPARKKAFSADAEIVEVGHAEYGMIHLKLELPQDVDLRKLKALKGEMLTLKLFADPETVRRLAGLKPEPEPQLVAEGADATAH